jgi:hypothetical protein
MPLTKLDFQPGVNKDDTPLSSEGGWVDADKIRFVRGKPETMGGWDAITPSTFSGIARGGHAWTDIQGRRYVAWGTATKLYALVSGTIVDITPAHSYGVLVNPFSTSNGSPTVSVTHTDHALVTGQTITFTNQSAPVGGLTLSGAYTVTVTDANSYTITAGSSATSTATNGGGNVDYTAAFQMGLVSATGEAGGYGSGTYSAGGYGGSVTATDTLPRVWSLDNWGENLLAVPRGGALYEWQPAISYDEMMTNGDFASATGWTQGTGWSIAAGVATATAGTASDLSKPVAFTAGKVYTVTFTVTRTAGSLVFKTNGGTLGDTSAAISAAGTYTRTFQAPAGSTAILFSKDATFAGTIDNVSVKLASTAYRIMEAPSKNDTMFVDPNRIVVLIGTSLYGDTYNPLATRWSDRENNRSWVPSNANLSGDFLLAQGGRAIAGMATRQQNVVWTDNALYTMQFTGDTTNVFSFRLAGTGCGLAGPLAKAEHNGTVFWKSKDNFFLFQGGGPQIIPCPVRRDALENLAQGQEDKVAAGINPGFSEVWWFYPDARDGNECSRYVAFKWDESPGYWTVGTFARSTWIKPGVFDYPIALGTDGLAYYHEKGTTAAGAALTTMLEGSYSDLDDGENLTTLLGIIPDFEGQTGAVNFQIRLKSFPAAAERIQGNYTAAPNTEKIDLRTQARLMKVVLTSSSSPSFWRLGSLRARIERSGARR